MTQGSLIRCMYSYCIHMQADTLISHLPPSWHTSFAFSISIELSVLSYPISDYFFLNRLSNLANERWDVVFPFCLLYDSVSVYC